MSNYWTRIAGARTTRRRILSTGAAAGAGAALLAACGGSDSGGSSSNAGGGTPGAPTNARAMDAHDIEYSWKRYSTTATQASEIVDAVGVTSVKAIDDMTVQIKMKAPSAGLFAAAAFIGSGRFNIVPREADDKFDLRREAHGAGYFQLESYEPSSRMVFTRNPGYFRSSSAGALPIVDRV